MNITIITQKKNEKSYSRMPLEQLVENIKNGNMASHTLSGAERGICFAAEWRKRDGAAELRQRNPLVLLALENLRDRATVQEYKRQACLVPYTLLCFAGPDGHSLYIVSTYTAEGTLENHTLIEPEKRYVWQWKAGLWHVGKKKLGKDEGS